MSGEVPLPPLREDLQLLRRGTDPWGAPVWIVLDPLRNRFFRISHGMFQLLSLWNASRTAARLDRALAAQFGRRLEADEMAAALRLLDEHRLIARRPQGAWRGLHSAAQRRDGWLMWLVHNYLFFKIPLVRPEPFIAALWPHVAFLLRPWFALLMGAVGAAGLYLVSRQWDAFIGTFPHLFSFTGAAVGVLAVVVVKLLHELGHAFAAHKYGCRVPTMGVAFMVMVPLLYTDVTDAWRLGSRRQRMAIDCSGMAAELYVAALALFLWAFIPDGPLRSAVFVLATVSWTMSLLVNANPFMRFDGYYVLADLVGVENLQPRAFRHLTWRLRELLFGLRQPPPESWPPRLDAMLTLYAIATTLYRLVLYLGIAVLVYHVFIKLLGIVLFIVEISFFILRPVVAELGQWWRMREEIMRRGRSYVSLALVAVAGLAAALPLSTDVPAPGLALPRELARLYPEEAGRIVTVHARRDRPVTAGEVLFVIASPALAQERQLVELELALAEERFARIGADAGDLAARGVIETQLGRLRAQRDGLLQREARLVVRAPFAGRVADLNEGAVVGRWIAREEQLAVLAGEGAIVRGYVAGDDRGRIAPGAPGWFVPDDPTAPRLPVAVTALAVAGSQALDVPELASHFGGAVAVNLGERGRLAPVAAQYAVTAAVVGSYRSDQTKRGMLLIEGRAESLIARCWRQVLRVLVREAGV